MKTFSLILAVAATLAVTQAAADDSVPQLELLTEEEIPNVVLLAQQDIAAMKKSGASEKDCLDLADTLCKEVNDNIQKAQTTINKLEDGSKCLVLGDAVLVTMRNELTKIQTELETSTKKISTLKSTSINHASTRFDSMTKGVCGWAFNTQYESTRVSLETEKTNESTIKGKISQQEDNIKTFITKQKKDQDDCLCKAKATSTTAQYTETAKIPKWEGEMKKCKMMRCVLEGTSSSSCEVPKVSLTKHTVITQATSATCAATTTSSTGK